MKKKQVFLIVLLILSLVTLAACDAAGRHTELYFVFGTDLEITAEGDDSSALADRIARYIAELEPLLSTSSDYADTSDVYRINSAAVGVPVSCSETTMEILAVAERVYRLSDGAYDPSVYPLVRLWGFDSESFAQPAERKPPSEDRIAAVLPLIGFEEAFSVDYSAGAVTKLTDGAAIDLGGIAKGYAADKARRLVGGAQSALIDLGGNITAANADFKVGIGNPRPSSAPYFGSMPLTAGQCVSTSGDYQRYYTYQGVNYHHILDPSTGSPAESGLISVTVVSEDGALGDAAATAVMALGAERGADLIEELGLRAVLIASDLSYTVVGDLNFKLK